MRNFIRSLSAATANPPRDGLRIVRLLFLALACIAIAGALTIQGVYAGADFSDRLPADLAAVALAAYWIYGLRRERFQARLAVVEAALLWVIAAGVADPLAGFRTFFVALQFRSLYGRRSEAMMTAGVFLVTFAVGTLLSPWADMLPRATILLASLALGGWAYLVNRIMEALEHGARSVEALRASEERNRQLFDHNPCAMWVIDPESLAILDVNQAASEMYGYARSEFLTKNLRDVRSRETVDELDHLQPAIASEEPFRRAVRHRRRDGSVMDVDVTAHLIEYRGRRAGLALLVDVSERKRLEARLQQSTRLEAVGQLAGGVAHDFNNMLTVIKLHSELLLEDVGPSSRAAQGVGEIARAAERGAQLTQQLLAYSRKQLLRPKRIALQDIVTECLPMLRRQVSDRVEITVEHEPCVGDVFADPVQIENVLTILVRNANDAMPDGGRLSICTAHREFSGPGASGAAAIHDSPIGHFTMLCVCDSGIGMSREVQAHLFEPFFTTKEQGRGKGLGLASVYGIARQSGGFVEVESEPGKGAMFRIFLPSLAAKAI